MSEHQYYEFLATDRPLTDGDRAELRKLSSRAAITKTGFTITYNFGDFKGNPQKMMARWFDLHLYRANWGTGRLMIKLPKQRITVQRIKQILGLSEFAELIDIGEDVILNVEVGYGDDLDDRWYNFDDGLDKLEPFVPLRQDLLCGDLRALYLIWLTGIEDGSLREDALEPLPGIAPLTSALDAFSCFLEIDRNLIEAAAEKSADFEVGDLSLGVVRAAIAAIPDDVKTTLLHRLHDGDAYVSADLRKYVRNCLSQQSDQALSERRTVSDLRQRVKAILQERKTSG